MTEPFVSDRKLTERELEAMKRAWDESMRESNVGRLPIILTYDEPPRTPLKFWALVPGIDT